MNLLDYVEMAVESSTPLVDPHIVGNVFVQKYYNHLYEKPAEVHKFYHEDSVLGRPGSDGEMVSVKSLKVSYNFIVLPRFLGVYVSCLFVYLYLEWKQSFDF